MAQALAMSRSALPSQRLLDIDARMQHAAARPVIIPETTAVDQGKVLISRDFRYTNAAIYLEAVALAAATLTPKE